MPAGKYYIGDPGYVVPPDRWIRWLQAHWKGEQYQGVPTAGFNTGHDGQYYAQKGSRGKILHCPVDSGIIAALPLEQAGPWLLGQQHTKNNIVEFREEFTCSQDDQGRIRLGDMTVNDVK